MKMNLIKGSLIAALLFVLAACGSNAGYNPEKCKELKAKIENKESFTESDYDEMIDQLSAMIKVYDEKQKSFGDDIEKRTEFGKSEEGKELATNALTFIFYLDAHKSDLSKGNAEKLQKLQKDLDKMK